MLELAILIPLLTSLLFLPLLLFLLIINKIPSSCKAIKNETEFPKSYPVIGHMIAYYNHRKDIFKWLSTLTIASPSSTFVLHRPFGARHIVTADPTVVEHILKTRFSVYQKGTFWKTVFGDLLGDGIVNADSETWKFQRQIASHEFNTNSLRKYILKVVDAELSDRLLPILSQAAKTNKVLDLQDILERLTFDNICNISFGYDPQYLSPSLPQARFAVAFDSAVRISAQRFRSLFPFWKVGRFLNVGSEKRLREDVREIREFANFIVIRKKQDMVNSSEESLDLLSRFLKSGKYEDKFLIDIVINFILAGRDTTSAALTWFFWLLHKNKRVETEILREIKKYTENNKNEEITDLNLNLNLNYTHAALCETMRLYPPVPVDIKEAITNDILPCGTPVKKGTRICYHPYAMGRMEKIWGPDWAEYRPERWLEIEDIKNGAKKRLRFTPRDPYSYPVFQGGPRICLGKEMAFLQMKRVVVGILGRFTLLPLVKEGFDPLYVPSLTAKMHGGLPVRVEENNIGK